MVVIKSETVTPLHNKRTGPQLESQRRKRQAVIRRFSRGVRSYRPCGNSIFSAAGLAEARHSARCWAQHQRTSPRPPGGKRGPCQKLQAERRVVWAAEVAKAALRSDASAAPRPTNSRRSSLSRAASRKAVMPQRRRSIHAKMPCA